MEIEATRDWCLACKDPKPKDGLNMGVVFACFECCEDAAPDERWKDNPSKIKSLEDEIAELREEVSDLNHEATNYKATIKDLKKAKVQ